MPREPRERVVVVARDRLVARGCPTSSRAARPTSSSSTWWSGVYGSITPRRVAPGATSADDAAAPRGARRSTIGRAGRREQLALGVAEHRRGARPRRGRAPSPRTASRRAACAAQLAHARRRRLASHARWKPPRPLIATIAPRASSAAASAIASHRRSTHRGRPRVDEAEPRPAHAGTRSAARGSAGRPGPRTRAGSRGHIGNGAIVVAARSYGTPRAIVKRGPQCVQLVNA